MAWKILLATVMLGIVWEASTLSAEQGVGYSYQDQIPPQEVRKPLKFRGLSRYVKDFRVLCDQIARDGRREEIYEMLRARDVRDSECPACKALFNTMSRGCKPGRTRSRSVSKQGEEPTEKIVRQREPRLSVVTLAVDIFTALRDEGEHNQLLLQAVQKLADALRTDPIGVVSREYYDILAEFSFSPFQELAWSHERELARAQKQQEWIDTESTEANEELDSLFGE